MTRRLERLTPDTLGDLPAPVRRDLTWESGPAALGTSPDDAEERKRDWVSAVLLEWGSCGRVAYLDDEPVGFVVYAPPAYLAGTSAFPTAPVSDDAVQLATLVVLEGHQGTGLGRALVQVMARDLVRRGGVRAVEAIAATEHVEPQRSLPTGAGGVPATGGIHDAAHPPPLPAAPAGPALAGLVAGRGGHRLGTAARGGPAAGTSGDRARGTGPQPM